MGKVKKVHYEKLINPECDRYSNRVKVQEADNGEVTIHFRNLKIVLHKHNYDEVEEWVNGFKIALENYEARSNK